MPKKGYKHLKEHKEKIIKGRKEYFKKNPDVLKGKNNPFYGKKHTEKTINNLKFKGKLRNSLKDKEGKSINNPRYGVKLSKEQIIKQRISLKKKYEYGFKFNFIEGNTYWNHPNAVKTRFKKGDLERIKKIKEWRKTFIFPTKDTSIEIKIQNFLKQLGIEFFTHQYIKIEHGYQCDILIPSMNLVIECDGNYWHKYPVGNDIDHIRTSELINKGFKVLRLWECEIKEMDVNKFKERINNF